MTPLQLAQLDKVERDINRFMKHSSLTHETIFTLSMIDRVIEILRNNTSDQAPNH